MNKEKSDCQQVADKWNCTLQEAEGKILATMDLLALDRENAVAFLDAVLLEIKEKQRDVT